MVERARSASRRPATTLIEMLVVISLIAMLVAALVPSLSKSMTLAKAAVCSHNLREINHALQMYEMENDGWLPSAEISRNGLRAIRDGAPWFAKLFPNYLDDPKIMVCPEDPFGFRMAKISDKDMTQSRVGDYASYGISGFMMTGADGALSRLGSGELKRPLTTILLADQGPDTLTLSSAIQGVNGVPRNAALLTWDDGYDAFSGRASRSWLTRRHGNGVNVTTAEGGVRDASTSEVMKKPVQKYYPDCAAGGCTLCNELGLAHYSFADERLFWWTGRTPSIND